MTILKSTGSWIEKIITNTRFPLSNEFYCIKSATKRHVNMMPTRVYFTHNGGAKNNPKISGASVTNFHLTLA